MVVRLLDIVVLQKNLPASNLTAGMRGTVVEIHENPRLAYEVEFCDERGAETVSIALTPDLIKPARR
jgi:hypothetical protein